MSEAPGTAYMVTHDGERVECLLEQVGAREWQATPVRDVDRDEIKHAFIDVLPPGCSVTFLIQGEPVLPGWPA